MKFTFRSALVAIFTVIASFSFVFYLSCNKDKGNSVSYSDKCKSIACANKGVCNDGVCTCPVGYEGTYCETVSRSKFIGVWNVTETGMISGLNHYALAISNNDSVNTVYISNFYNYFKGRVRAVITKDSILIPNQSLEGKIIFGKGYVYTDTLETPYSRISLRYEVIDSVSGTVDDFGYYPDVHHTAPSSWQKQ